MIKYSISNLYFVGIATSISTGLLSSLTDMNGWENQISNQYNLTIIHSADCADESFRCPSLDGSGSESGYYIQIVDNVAREDRVSTESTIISPLLKNAFSTCRMVFK